MSTIFRINQLASCHFAHFRFFEREVKPQRGLTSPPHLILTPPSFLIKLIINVQKVFSDVIYINCIILV